MESEAIKKKLRKIAELEQKHGVLGVSLNPSNDAKSEDVLDYVVWLIKDSARLIKNKLQIRRV